MDIEFHYYITYLIAKQAELGNQEAHTVAHACQYVDDNDISFEVDKDQATYYRNYISQTMNILKPKRKLFRIYPVFHFIPGDPLEPDASRKDGRLHWLNTTAGSPNAGKIMDAALAGGDLYRIGIGLHGYADTWAHQNFVGYWEEFNSLKGPLEKLIPNIGHAEAGHHPDIPSLVWYDPRLLKGRVENNQRFLAAARAMLDKLLDHTNPNISKKARQEKQDALAQDLTWALGGRDQVLEEQTVRLARYQELSTRTAYGASEIPAYDPDDWFDAVVNEKVRGLRDRSDLQLIRWDPLTDVYTWKDRTTYQTRDWFRFQEAVKAHQEETLAILMQSNLANLELPEF